MSSFILGSNALPWCPYSAFFFRNEPGSESSDKHTLSSPSLQAASSATISSHTRSRKGQIEIGCKHYHIRNLIQRFRVEFTFSGRKQTGWHMKKQKV